jgi:predicted DNA repair protein MutK
MKFLSVAGTAAMFLVGGGILVHAIPVIHHWVEGLPPITGLSWLVPNLANAVIGILAGILVLLAVMAIRRMRGLPAVPAH